MNDCRYVWNVIVSFCSQWTFLNISVPTFPMPCSRCLRCLWLRCNCWCLYLVAIKSVLNSDKTAMPSGPLSGFVCNFCCYATKDNLAWQRYNDERGTRIYQLTMLLLNLFRLRGWNQNVRNTNALNARVLCWFSLCRLQLQSLNLNITIMSWLETLRVKIVCAAKINKPYNFTLRLFKYVEMLEQKRKKKNTLRSNNN